MRMQTVADALRLHIRNLCRAEGGNVAAIFAIAMIPIIGLTGAAIDYSRAAAIRTAMQAAVDATALAMSKEATTVSESQLQTDADAYFAAAFNRPEAQNVTVNVQYSPATASTLTVSASGSVATKIMGILHIDSIAIGAKSTTEWGMKRLRVALVLDNTGSMADAGKMDALQSATKSLLSQLQSAVTQDGDVYVSIVPFVKDVNLDPSNRSASWIDWTDWDENNGSCNRGSSFRTQSACTQAPVCSRTWYTSKSTCQNNGGTWYTRAGTWTVESHSDWTGCVVDRGDSGGPNAGNYDTNVEPPTAGNSASLFQAEKYSSCPQAVMGLSTDWSGMNTVVDGMSPDGSTNQAIGLALGWMSLAGGGPFTVPSMDPNYDYTQAIILLTDGLNTQDRWYGNGSDPDTRIDDRQKMTCDNAKAAGISLYTIQVNTGSDPVSTLLQNCASSSDQFFYLTSSDQIAGVFSAIGTKLSKLRITK